MIVLVLKVIMQNILLAHYFGYLLLNDSLPVASAFGHWAEIGTSLRHRYTNSEGQRDNVNWCNFGDSIRRGIKDETEEFNTDLPTRRIFARNVLASFSAAAALVSSSEQSDAAVLQSGSCASGEGEGCDTLAEGNDFIKNLQKKSAEKRDQYAREAREAYNMKNYPDYFASLTPPRYLVKKSDGSFTSFTEAELSDLKKNGRIGIEIPRAMGGKVTDYTQKPIMVLRD